jgi:cytochrome c6
MKRIVVVAALLAFAGVAQADGEEGAPVYAKRCAMCHGKDGKPTAVGTKMGAKDLSTLKLDAAAVEKVVTEGKGKMTGFKGKLTVEEIHEVSEYVAAGLK